MPSLLTAIARTARRCVRNHAAAVLAVALAVLLPLAQVGALAHALLHLPATGAASAASTAAETADDDGAAPSHGSGTCALCPVYAQLGAAANCFVTPAAAATIASGPLAAVAPTRTSAFTTAYWPRGPPHLT